MTDALIAHLHDLLDPLGRVDTRPMFGGHGVYVDGVIVGVIMEEAFYLKVDAETQLHFEAAGSQPYVYLGQDQPITLSYWSVPEQARNLPRRCGHGRNWRARRRCGMEGARGDSDRFAVTVADVLFGLGDCPCLSSCSFLCPCLWLCPCPCSCS
ncbi:TfoX/Sxy family protein [Lysobacter sp.]|uniref:TfoX/Sxy family protein n=1 Tax=Lysobacter sp. TaxID=72226 RepID=UPI002D496F3C|nr:TfoX/Sxy family protein [Lysobacter sp.]HZX76654.1 TfoX/Sxy family protein [Lysobacter sp.]